MATILKFLGSTISYIASLGSFLYYMLKKAWKIVLVVLLIIVCLFTFGKVNKLSKKQSC